jgi:hypothetical protein
MAMKQVIEIYDLLDSARVNGDAVSTFLKGRGLEQVAVKRVGDEKSSTDFIKMIIPGSNGKSSGGEAGTLGIIGRLGGIGARPERVGIVSDADGAISALACALKLADMGMNGDILKGDVIVATHICPSAPMEPHDPVPFMGHPVDMMTMNKHEVDPAMDALLSIDATKGNRIIKNRGFAITPAVKDGYILRVSEDLLDIMQWVTGGVLGVVPITTQDITPYGNGLYHLNSIMQPWIATSAAVVGVAITSEVPVPGCATGANQIVDLELAVRFCIEVAKAFGEGNCRFYDDDEFTRITEMYGSMAHLRTRHKS